MTGPFRRAGRRKLLGMSAPILTPRADERATHPRPLVQIPCPRQHRLAYTARVASVTNNATSRPKAAQPTTQNR